MLLKEIRQVVDFSEFIPVGKSLYDCSVFHIGTAILPSYMRYGTVPPFISEHFFAEVAL